MLVCGGSIMVDFVHFLYPKICVPNKQVANGKKTKKLWII